MTNLLTLRAGTRSSNLAVTQTQGALDKIQALIPGIYFDRVEVSSPGDRDLTSDLRDADVDFFTRDLDDALRDGRIDLGVHSAKDLPDPLPDDMDWFWLPWSAEPRDVLVTRKGVSIEDMPKDGVVGISSERRAEYCHRVFPSMQHENIRGTIEQRLQQLDDGHYDLVIMAAAALVRLGLQDRISAWVSKEDLPPPHGQGVLAITFLKGSKQGALLRSMLIHPLVIAGAGTGTLDACTYGAIESIKNCDVCLHDSLIPAGLLSRIPPEAEIINVGKRSGQHYMTQPDINAQLIRKLKEGKKVVRLKGGDPGVFGRLGEETEALEDAELAFRVLPGVSSLFAATTGTGLLLTRRGLNRGVTLITPREAGGASQPIDAAARQGLPIAVFMGVSRAGELATQLMNEGRSSDESAAMIFDLGLSTQRIVFSDLSHLEEALAEDSQPGTGLLLVGDIAQAQHLYNSSHTPLAGRHVLITCTPGLQEKAAQLVYRYGGVPLRQPLVETRECAGALPDLDDYDYIALTSPSSIRVFMNKVLTSGMDVRQLPSIMTCGPGSKKTLAEYGLSADISPEKHFGREGLVEQAAVLTKGARVLRFRSDQAGTALADELATIGMFVDDHVLYETVNVDAGERPQYDAVFFASGSAVRSFVDQWGEDALVGPAAIAIGTPTMDVLRQYGIEEAIVPSNSTIPGALAEYAASELVVSLLRATSDLSLDS